MRLFPVRQNNQLRTFSNTRNADWDNNRESQEEMGPQAKRRKVAAKVDEVNFDPAARHEFLTGFRKRKLQRARHAQEIAEKRAKEDARQDRKRVCNDLLDEGNLRYTNVGPLPDA